MRPPYRQRSDLHLPGMIYVKVLYCCRFIWSKLLQLVMVDSDILMHLWMPMSTALTNIDFLWTSMYMNLHACICTCVYIYWARQVTA